jgi:hypothetical protein
VERTTKENDWRLDWLDNMGIVATYIHRRRPFGHIDSLGAQEEG